MSLKDKVKARVPEFNLPDWSDKSRTFHPVSMDAWIEFCEVMLPFMNKNSEYQRKRLAGMVDAPFVFRR